MLSKIQLIISFHSFMKHGFKPKLKHTFLTKGWPWWFASYQSEQQCGSSLPWWKMGYGVCHIVCDPFSPTACPQSVPSSCWKNTGRLVIGIHTIVIGNSLFTEGRKPHLWYTLGHSMMRVRRHIQVPLGQETAYPPKSHQHKAVCILHVSYRASAENITLEFQTVSVRVMPLVLQVWQKCLNCLLNLLWYTQANWIHHIVTEHCFKRQISC